LNGVFSKAIRSTTLPRAAWPGGRYTGVALSRAALHLSTGTTRMKMKSNKAGHRGQGRRGDRPQGGHSHQNNGHGGGARQGRPNGHGRRFGGGGRAARGPTTCPMCGVAVTDLGAHIRSRHDDPQSHPRD
jgi:hypothetical protein